MSDETEDPQDETPVEATPVQDRREMPFLDHLEELRWRLIKALAALFVGVLICGLFTDQVLAIILRPGRKADPPVQFINTHPMGMFLVRMNSALVGGLILALPFILYQLWMFVAPGLYRKERRYVMGIVAGTVACFLMGASLAYFGAIPTMLKFLMAMGTEDIKSMIDVNKYISFVLFTIISFGAVFELPMVAFFLARFGVLTPAFLRHYRRYAYLGIFVVAAVATPSPDPFSQVMLAIPLCILYEVSIWVTKFAGKETPEIWFDLRPYRRYAYLVLFAVVAATTPSLDPFSQVVVVVPLCILYEICIRAMKLSGP